MAAAKRGGNADEDGRTLHVRLSPEAHEILAEMAAARGGPWARRAVVEEALRIYHGEDPVLARFRRKKKPKAEEPST